MALPRVDLVAPFCVALFLLSPAAAQPAPEPEAPEAADSEDTDAANEARRARVYARVGQVVISVGDIEDAINRQSPLLRSNHDTPAALRRFADGLVRFELMAQEAERRGYGDNPSVRRSAKQNAVQQLIHRDFDSAITPESITAEEVAAEYQSRIAEFSSPELVRASHILFDSRETAETHLEAIRSADEREFRRLARTLSVDTETKLRGGDLRYFGRDGRPVRGREDDPAVDAQIIEAAFALEEVGDTSGVVEVGAHFSVIRKRGHRPAEVRTLEQVEGVLRNEMWRQRRQDGIDELVRELRTTHPPETHPRRMANIRLDPLPGASQLGNHPPVPGRGMNGGMVPMLSPHVPGRTPGAGPTKQIPATE